uniref:Uncharacterized protein n=1 Tax=Ascaris lumbricoides TaxID=6252 RepID=A0A0M3I1K0_ASCLU
MLLQFLTRFVGIRSLLNVFCVEKVCRLPSIVINLRISNFCVLL